MVPVEFLLVDLDGPLYAGPGRGEVALGMEDHGEVGGVGGKQGVVRAQVLLADLDGPLHAGAGCGEEALGL